MELNNNETVLDLSGRVADDPETTVAKAIAMCCLFMIAMICGIIPFKLAQIFKWNEPTSQNSQRRDAKTSLTVSCLLSFGGGCLLATTFLHLLPEIGDEIKVLQSKGIMPDFVEHIAELLMCTGFFVIYLVEELVHAYLHRRQHISSKNNSIEHKKSQISIASDISRHHLDAEELGVAFERGLHARSSSIINRYPSLRGDTSGSIEALPNANGSISTADLIKNDIIILEQSQRKISTIDLKPETPNNHNHNHHNHSHNHTHNNHNHSHNHGHSHMVPIDEEDFLVSSIRGLLIVLALSVHELFEGLAVGLESSSGNVYYMFAAVSVHKFVIAFCIGVELMVQNTRLWLAVVYIFVYSVVSPIGIGIGIALSTGSAAEASQVPSVILQGLASGTLLYVIFFEVLSKDRSGLIQYLAVVLGFCLMFALQFVGGHQHSHNHGAAGHEAHGHSHSHSHDHDHGHEMEPHSHSHYH